MATDPRLNVIATARAMGAHHLNRGAAGNVSVRARQDGVDGFFITPTGMPYETLVAEDIPWMGLDGRTRGTRKPSSEWHLHRDLYARRADVGAVLHAHAPFATALACLRLDIPPFHYMIARFGGDTVRCSAYALFGTADLAAVTLQAMQDRSACLLANHGMVVCAADADAVLARAIELEALCEQYWRARQLGAPVLLTPAEMDAAIAQFSGYGHQG